MTEPLFELPEVYPPPAPRARPRRPGRRRGVSQPSLFSAVLAEPAPADLAGLLAAGGQVTRLGGTARVSVVVARSWRVDALLGTLADCRLSGSRVSTVESHVGVRTAFSAPLASLADRWLHGTVVRPPAGFVLTGWMLRLWVVAGGRPDSTGYLLPLPGADASWYPLQSALRAAGFAGDLLTGAPALRVTGRTARRSLADLVGPPPEPAAGPDWP